MLFYGPRGDLNASEEIIWPEKKYSTFAQKWCTLELLLANSAPFLVFFRNFAIASMRLDERDWPN
jgi:hypothetical protein